MEFSSYFHARGWPVAFAHDPEDGQAGEDERCSDERAFEVAEKTPDQDGGRAEDEDRGQHGVSPYAIGACQIRLSAAIVEHRGCGEHVEEPLGEDGEFEVLLELAKKEQQ